MTANRQISLNSFQGTWQLSRTISDQMGQSSGQFEGIAVFAPEDGGLTYVETGTLQLNSQPSFKAERKYFWRADGDKVAIDFDDGRFFHSFDPTAPQADHWCDPDTYTVTYTFDLWPNWQSTWDVRGPRKAYTLVNSYTPTTA